MWPFRKKERPERRIDWREIVQVVAYNRYKTGVEYSEQFLDKVALLAQADPSIDAKVDVIEQAFAEYEAHYALLTAIPIEWAAFA